MSASVEFPVAVDAVFVGQAGSSGSFTDSETGEVVNYSEAYAFDFEDAEGNTQRIKLRGSKIVQVGDFDPAKATKYADRVRLEGAIVLNQNGGRSFFRPTAITKAARS